MLGVIVAAVGRQTETYIAHHIDSILPNDTAVCSLLPCDAPAWRPSAEVRVNELYRSRHLTTQAIRHMLRIASPPSLERLDLARLRHWLGRQEIQVVLCEFLDVAVTVFDACRRLSLPLVAHAHGYDVAGRPKDGRWAQLYAERLPLMDDIVVVSNAMKARVLRFGVAEDKVHVVPCGTVVDSTPPRVHADKTEYVVFATGRLIAKKGPVFLLEAFRQIHQRARNTRLLVAGDGPFREPMEQFIRATGMENSVVMLGEIPNAAVRDNLRHADLFLQHSVTANDGDEEGLPVSLLEAMAEGVPVVATDHAGIPEVVDDGKTGFLVPPGDATAMADRSLRLLANSALRSQVAAAAKQVILDRFSLESEIGQLRSIVTRHMNS